MLLGLQRFVIPPGKTATLKIKVSKRGRRLLARRGRLPVQVIVETISPTGKPLVQHKAVTLRAKRRHRRR